MVNDIVSMIKESDASYITVITPDNRELFDSITAEHRTVALFMTDWCGPCRMQIISLLENSMYKQFLQQNEMKSVYLDADEFPDITQKISLHNIPAIIPYDKGSPMSSRIIGVHPVNDVIRKLEEFYTL